MSKSKLARRMPGDKKSAQEAERLPTPVTRVLCHNKVIIASTNLKSTAKSKSFLRPA